MKKDIERRLERLESIKVRRIDCLADFSIWAAQGFPDDTPVVWNPIVKKGLEEFAAKAKERNKSHSG